MTDEDRFVAEVADFVSFKAEQLTKIIAERDAAIAEAVAQEREACAKIVEEDRIYKDDRQMTDAEASLVKRLAADIRARGTRKAGA